MNKYNADNLTGGGETSYNLIPVVHCFNNNFSLPASVAFYSMLKNANNNYFYKLIVLSSDISDENKQLLFETVKPFKNAELEFIDMNNKFDKIFLQTKSKSSFSKEMYYKLITASIFPQYDKIILADVDVVYMGDISSLYEEFDVNESYYLYGSCGFLKADKNYYLNHWINNNYKNFTNEEKSKLKILAGLLVINNKKIREDNIEEKFIDFLQKNKERIVCPEQDVLNLVCHPHIKLMKENALVCYIDYNFYNNINLNNYENGETIKQALNNPIQLHYAGSKKPWNSFCEKNEIWFEYLIKTPMFKPFTEKLFGIGRKKKVFSFVTPFIKRKFTLTKEKIF